MEKPKLKFGHAIQEAVATRLQSTNQAAKTYTHLPGHLQTATQNNFTNVLFQLQAILHYY